MTVEVLRFPNALGRRRDWPNLGRRVRMERTQAHLSVADVVCATELVPIEGTCRVSASTIRRLEKGMPVNYFKVIYIGLALGHTTANLWDWGWAQILYPDHR